MAANAADVYARPRYAPPPPVYAPPPFSWTGFYLGGNIGAAWAHRDETDTFFLGDFGGGNNNGVFIGGGQLGYNWQVGYAVLGIEWDIDGAANNNNTGTVFIPRVGTIQLTTVVDPHLHHLDVAVPHKESVSRETLEPKRSNKCPVVQPQKVYTPPSPTNWARKPTRCPRPPVTQTRKR